MLVELISYLSSSPPPRFSRDPESGVEVLLTVPMLSTMLPLDMFSEEPELEKKHPSNVSHFTLNAHPGPGKTLSRVFEILQR